MPTTGISLVRHHTEQMQLPRFLWVPFPLGRPFGAPHDAGFQRRVLREALSLFERGAGPVLEDFPDDAPVSEEERGEVGWSCPVSFAPPEDGRSDLVKQALAEIDRLEPWIEHRGGAAFISNGPLSLRDVIEAFGAIADGGEAMARGDVPLQEWVRLGCDDLRGFAIEASKAQPGHASVKQREDWFWRETAIARVIGGAAAALVAHESPLVQALARRAMVPRIYLEHLVPGVDPFI